MEHYSFNGLKEMIGEYGFTDDFVKHFSQERLFTSFLDSYTLPRIYSEVINNAFPWASTKEGDFFWNEKWRNLRRKIFSKIPQTYVDLKCFLEI